MESAIITASSTGGFGTKEEIPGLPITPEEIAVSARESYEAGAAVVHVHLRDTTRAGLRPTWTSRVAL